MYIAAFTNWEDIQVQMHKFIHIILKNHYLELLTIVITPLCPPTATVSLNTVISWPCRWAGSHINLSPLAYVRKPCVSNLGMFNGWAGFCQILIWKGQKELIWKIIYTASLDVTIFFGCNGLACLNIPQECFLTLYQLALLWGPRTKSPKVV